MYWLARPILSAEDRPDPVGLGALGPHWLPRCNYAGTFDETAIARAVPFEATEIAVGRLFLPRTSAPEE